MKTILVFFASLIIATGQLLAQVPQAFSYQAIARDSKGKAIENTNIGIRIGILDGSATGSLIYEETHTATTNDIGLFSIKIGLGTVSSGSFSTIDWGTSVKYLEIAVDVNGGNSYTDMGTIQLLSVPYALYAEKSGGDDDNDSENELQDITLEGTELSISQGSTVDLADLADVTDTDDQTLTLTGTELSIEDGNSVDLAPIVTDDQNLALENTMLSIEDGNTVDLASIKDDADADPVNEIQDLSLEDDVLTITGKEGATPVDLTPYKDNTDDQLLTLDGTELSIEDGNMVDLSDFVNSADTDPENELQELALTDHELSITNGNTVTLPDNVEDADADPGNELQDLQILDDILSLSNDPTPVDLTVYRDNTDDQLLSLEGTELSIEDGNTVNLTDFMSSADTDPENELQDLALTDHELSITNGNTVTLPDNVDDADADPGNELQDLQILDDILSLSNDPTPVDLTVYRDNTDDQQLTLTGSELSIEDGNIVDFSGLLNDADEDPSNELQLLELTDHELSISSGNMVTLPDNVNDADADPENELQDLVLADHDLTISGRNTIVLPDNVDDADADPENELQDLELTGHDLTISGRNTIVLPDEVEDADADPTNEIQDLNLVGDILSVTGNPGATPIDLAPYKINTDNQDLQLSGNILSLTNDATPVDLAGYLDNTDEQNLEDVLGLGNNAGGMNIINLANPLDDLDAATKAYVDSHSGGLWTPSAGDIYYNAGKVGIGITHPLYPLHVNGEIHALSGIFEGDVDLGGTLSLAGDIQFGNLLTGPNASFEDLEVGPGLHFRGNSITRDGDLAMNITGITTITGRLAVEDKLAANGADISSDLYVEGNIQSSTGGLDVAGDVNAGGSINAFGDVIANRGTFTGDVSSGNSMTASLADFGSLQVANDGTGSDIVQIGITSTPNRLRFSSGANNALITTGDTYDGTKGLVINHATGFVGMGIFPTTRLHVDGVITGTDIIESTSGGFKFPDGTVQETAVVSASGGYTLDQAYDQGGLGAGRTITADNGAVNIDGNDGLTVNGYLGIGTTSPTHPLTIVSQLRDSVFYLDYDLTSPAISSQGMVIDVDKDIPGNTLMYGARISTTNNQGTGLTYGISSKVDGTSGSGKIGVNSEVGGEGNLYGVVANVTGLGSGKHYGVAATAKDWAGYFQQKVYISEQLSIGTETPSIANLHVEGDDGFLFSGGGGIGGVPIYGPGTYMMWCPGKFAFRAGEISPGNDFWNDEYIGSASFSTGIDTKASGDFSVAMGHLAHAEGDFSTAIGENILVSGDYSYGITLDNGAPIISQAHTMAIMGGSVGINEATPTAELQVGGVNGVLFTGEWGEGTIPLEGYSGPRMMWYPSKAAFRVGETTTDSWDDVNIGTASFATGGVTKASGTLSAAFGFNTTATGYGSFVTGKYTEASGDYSTAMGAYVNTSGDGSFAIGDNSTTTASTFSTANQFNARFANGYNLYTDASATIGVTLAASGSSWSSISDSTKKENVKAINGEIVLKKIRDFRLGSWNYKGQDPVKFRHYGPMAQDFFAAFGHDGIGIIGNDTTIASADFDGINLIAIQALEKRTTDLKKKITDIETLQTEIKELRRENNSLKTRLNDLEGDINELKLFLVNLHHNDNLVGRDE